MAKQQTPMLDTLVDRMFEIREQTRALNKQLEELKAESDKLAETLLEAMDAQGTDIARSDLATASISTSVVPHVINWDDFYTFIHRKKAYFLLERRPATAAYREMLESMKGKPVPGVESFTKRTISLRVRS